MAAGGKVIVNAGALTADATTITTTLDVAGASTLTGNVAAGGTMGVVGNFWIGNATEGSAKLNVVAASGNIQTDGTLTVDGASTLTGAVSAANAVLSSHATAGIGYGTGAGGAVTQETNRTTGVTLNTICGTITTNNASLAAGAEATFTVTNSAVAATDVVVVSLQDATPTSGALSIPFVTDVAAGSFKITLTNLSADTADVGASKINFCVIKGVAS